MQLANVLLGGSLIEDISAELGARYTVRHHQVRELGLPRNEPSHSIKALNNSALRRILGRDRARVNSTHHQAVRQIATGLEVAAISDDGLVEALEGNMRASFFLGVQWHPEALPTVDQPSYSIFESFVGACAQADIRLSGLPR
jgi:putative glutamine amidotransferase